LRKLKLIFRFTRYLEALLSSFALFSRKDKETELFVPRNNDTHFSKNHTMGGGVLSENLKKNEHFVPSFFTYS